MTMLYGALLRTGTELAAVDWSLVAHVVKLAEGAQLTCLEWWDGVIYASEWCEQYCTLSSADLVDGTLSSHYPSWRLLSRLLGCILTLCPWLD